MIEWSRLRILDAVARAGSVTGAAAALGLTGPSVTQQLRRLEGESGVRVVEPDGRGIRLTPAGERLARTARAVAELVQAADNDLSAEHVTGVVRVGAVASSVRALVAPAVAALAAAHPDVVVRLVDGESADHVAALASGSLDLVVAESWEGSPLALPTRVRAERLLRREVVLALPAAHPGADRASGDLADVADAVWTACAPGSDSDLALVQAARASGFDVDVRLRVADHVTQLALVAAGAGVALVPVGEDPLPDGAVLRPLDPPLHRDIVLVGRTGTPPLAVTALADAIREVADGDRAAR